MLDREFADLLIGKYVMTGGKFDKLVESTGDTDDACELLFPAMVEELKQFVASETFLHYLKKAIPNEYNEEFFLDGLDRVKSDLNISE